jgi:hypothetical protein
VAPSLPVYTALEIERIAAATLRARAAGGVVTIPVDVEALIEAGGAVIETVRGLAGHGVLASTWTHPDEQRVTVVIDEELFDRRATRARFTLAEELGHLVLHGEIIKGITTVEDAVALHQHPSYYCHLDRNAKRFAAALLMPPERVRDDAAQMFIKLRALGHSQVDLTRILTIRLAQRYFVSPEAMGYRLRESPILVLNAIAEAFRRGLPTLPRGERRGT